MLIGGPWVLLHQGPEVDDVPLSPVSARLCPLLGLNGSEVSEDVLEAQGLSVLLDRLSTV